MTPEAKFFIVDGHSYGFQAYYATSALQTPSGLPVGAVYTFTGLIEKLLGERPSHLAVVFDAGESNFRTALYPEYKKNRSPVPEEMHRQVDLIREGLVAYRLPVLESEGYEADDVIATLARHASRAGIPTYIVSKDKDLEQLIDEHVRIYDPKDGSLLDAAGLLARKGLRPDQVIDYLALVGDSIDNVPGIDGVGPKSAIKILAAAGSLERALAGDAPGLPPKLLEKLQMGRKSAELSRELVTLNDDCPIPSGCEPEGYL